ncbi:MAG: peroxide stress protein YaaA [Clostridiales bacterium]|nr:peroxide stress protein YaaA [Clostridiales bacterium]
MRIIISPAKKMKVDNDYFGHSSMPIFIDETEKLLDYLKKLNYDELKSIWRCSDNIAKLNFNRIQNMDLYNNLSSAIFSYEGIQYKYMVPNIFTYDELDYIDEHLRILSGFYGILRPFDGVVPHRLEMQSKLINWRYKTLYDFWKDKIAKQLFLESKYIVNLASKEYSDCISKYLGKDIQLINCVFGEITNDKIIQKGTLVKMARGEMVRFMAKNNIKNLEDIKKFNELGYVFNKKLSYDYNYVFIKKT